MGAMSPTPLPGPHGLYTVSAMPRFLADSAQVAWAGVYFTDIQAVPEGRVDHAHARLCIRRTAQREWRRHAGTTSWERVEPAVHVLHAGDEERLDWREAGRAQFLFIGEEQLAALLGRVPRQLALRGTLDEGRSRLPALLIDALVADLAQGSPAGPLVGESVIAALVAHVAGAPPPAPGTLGARARARTLELIEARYAERLSLEALAQAAGLSVRQFTRAFRAELGCSPHQYILRRRIEQARRLIVQGMPLAEVAQHCGFADQSQFTRVFQRCTGSTPGRFRGGRG